MSDDERALNQKILTVLFGATVSTAAIVTQSPELLAFATVARPMAELGFAALNFRLKVRLQAAVSGYIKAAAGKDPDVITKELGEAQKEPRIKNAVYDTFRDAMNAEDEHVVPYLGRLLYEYQHNHITRSMFRSFGRVLCDLDAKEFDGLRRILAGAVAAIDKPRERTGQINVFAGHDFANVHHADRLIALLRQNGLAYEQVTDLGGVAASWKVLILDDDARTMHGIVRVDIEVVEPPE